MIILPARKNAQSRPSLVFIADTRAQDGAVARLRVMVTRITGKIPPTEGFLQDPRYLFRSIEAESGHTQWHRQKRRLGSGLYMLSDSQYGVYLRGFKAAARVCCGFGPEAVKEIGTQSLRSGGDTWLHAQGLTAEERRDVGQWATPLVGRGYLRRTLTERLAFMRPTGL